MEKHIIPQRIKPSSKLSVSFDEAIRYHLTQIINQQKRIMDELNANVDKLEKEIYAGCVEQIIILQDTKERDC